MVAAWGGYVFIINIIPIYVVVMVVAGRYSSRLYIAYSTFYALGSIMAMQVPFVGFNVVKQAECMASHGVFLGIQVRRNEHRPAMCPQRWTARVHSGREMIVLCYVCFCPTHVYL